MHDLQHFFSVCLDLMDKIAYCILLCTVGGILLNLDFFAIDTNQYDNEIITSYKCLRYLFLSIAILTLFNNVYIIWLRISHWQEEFSFL